MLAGTFAVLGTLPITFLTELGFAVAFGVLLDSMVVRSVLVAAAFGACKRRLITLPVISRRRPGAWQCRTICSKLWLVDPFYKVSDLFRMTLISVP